MSSDRADRFGDAGLAHVELLPLPVEQRVLVGFPVVVLWLAAAADPSVYAFACGQVAFLPRLGALALGLTLMAGLAVLATRSAPKYGLAFAPLCRAAMGARGSSLVLLLRAAVGAFYLAAWAAPSGAWLALLVVAGAGGDVQPMVVDAMGWGAAGLLLVGAWLIAARGMARIVRFARWGVVAAAVLLAVLVVYGGIASRGFGDLKLIDDTWSWGGVTEAAPAAWGLALIGVVSASDWLRFVARTSPGRATAGSLKERWLALAMLGGVSLAFVGVLVAAASLVVRGRFDGHPIADAAGFGGLVGGGAGLLLLVGLWSFAAPVVGLYSPALAWCALAPRLVTYRRGVALTVLVAACLVPLWSYLTELGLHLDEAATLLLAPFGVLVADELWRRGKIALEELYVQRSDYAPLGGVRLAGVLGVLCGWLVHPYAAPLVAQVEALSPWLGALSAGARAIAGFALAFVVYFLIAPFDVFLARLARRRVPASVRSDTATGVTNPHFIYDENERPK